MLPIAGAQINGRVLPAALASPQPGKDGLKCSVAMLPGQQPYWADIPSANRPPSPPREKSDIPEPDIAGRRIGRRPVPGLPAAADRPTST